MGLPPIYSGLMIITRTPFRFTLGGGGTDLPAYYSKYGGMVFAAAIDKYMYISVNRPIVDDHVRVKYSKSEQVGWSSDLQHELARAALEHAGIKNAIEIISMADIPAGTGLGSSSCYMVGLLNALYALKRDYRPVGEIAELACHLEMNILKKTVGKQDQYLASFGGLPVLEIDKEGNVKIRQANVSAVTLDDLRRSTMIFYTGTTRHAEEILRDQSQSVKKDDSEVIESLHKIKEIGYVILEAIESGNIDRFGLLMDEHWKLKNKLSSKIATPRLHRIYEIAKENGALGGKVTGAGGGGFFILYTTNRHQQLRKVMKEQGLRELRYQFDLEGSKILVNFADGRGQYEPNEQFFWNPTRYDDFGIQGTSKDIHPDL